VKVYQVFHVDKKVEEHWSEPHKKVEKHCLNTVSDSNCSVWHMIFVLSFKMSMHD